MTVVSKQELKASPVIRTGEKMVKKFPEMRGEMAKTGRLLREEWNRGEKEADVSAALFQSPWHLEDRQ
jgi:hypothetical protein